MKDRTLSIDLEVFKKIPNKVTLASGVQKAYAVLSAVKGGLVDTLIVDSNLGTRLLELAQTEL